MIIELDILDLLVNITDRETILIASHYEVFPRVPHLLYAWHINYNVKAKYKPEFETKED